MANKNYKLQTHVDETTKEKLDNLCTKSGESLSSLIRRALLKLLVEEDNDI
jgi:antitoxin component of RelBE/YafQ-DinJ toxin-antitoxin module